MEQVADPGPVEDPVLAAGSLDDARLRVDDQPERADEVAPRHRDPLRVGRLEEEVVGLGVVAEELADRVEHLEDRPHVLHDAPPPARSDDLRPLDDVVEGQRDHAPDVDLVARGDGALEDPPVLPPHRGG
ncbi:MAG: hypothetical protein R3B09_33015 [Nannocystaceae bacterium]